MKKKAMFFFALKSIHRQKTRNFFIVFIICLTCVFSLFSSSLFEGKNEQIQNAIMQTETGSFQIIEKEYYFKSNPGHVAELNDQLRNKLSSFTYTPELLLKTTILSPEGSQELTLIGIDPESHELVFPMKDSITGSWPLTELNQDGIVVGRKFADKFKLSIGDEVIITYQDNNKAILNESLPVVGIFSKNGESFERSYSYVGKNLINRLLHLKNNKYFHRIIFSKNNKTAPQINEYNLILKSWDKLHPELGLMIKFHHGIIKVLIIFMLLVSFISITTPLNILWEERKNEVKLLRTIGTSKFVLYKLAAAEAFVLTGSALLMAILLWLVLFTLSARYGIDFSSIGQETVTRGGILLSSIVYPSVNVVHSIVIVLFHGILIFTSQLYCIRKILKTEGTDG